MQGYYRVITALSYGGTILRPNSIHWLRLPPENIAKLIEIGSISAVKTPPISEVPLLENFEARLKKKGITTVQQFLEAQHSDLTSIWRRKDHLDNLKQQIINTYLIVETKPKDCNC